MTNIAHSLAGDQRGGPDSAGRCGSVPAVYAPLAHLAVSAGDRHLRDHDLVDADVPEGSPPLDEWLHRIAQITRGPTSMLRTAPLSGAAPDATRAP